MTTLSTTILGTVYETESDNLPQASVEFLLAYGYRQYLADGAAVAKEDKDGNVRDQDEIDALKVSGVEKRWDNVQIGTFPAGGGQRDPFTTELNRVAREAFAGAVKATGKTLPKDKETKREMLRRFTEKNYGKLERIARDNLARKADLDPFEVE
jgi:hypothetical protein